MFTFPVRFSLSKEAKMSPIPCIYIYLKIFTRHEICIGFRENLLFFEVCAGLYILRIVNNFSR
jgi:hypothetical protein